MRKFVLLLVIMTFVSSMVFAQDIKAYGSARLNAWYNLADENLSNTGESDLDLDYALQGNSRFGVNFKNDNMTAKVEYGTGVNLRLLWAKLKMDGYSILIGQDYDGTSEYAAQVYKTDNGLIGFGAVDGGRNPQVKIEMESGLYYAFIKPICENNIIDTLVVLANADVLLPKINIGYKMKMDNLYIHPTLVLQSFSYSKKENFGLSDDATILSYLLAVTGQMDMDPMMIRGQLNYGSNTGNMGYKGPNNFAELDNSEIVSTSTLGFFGEFGYNLNETTRLDAGLGFASSSNDNWDKSDSQMSIYLQSKTMIDKLQIIPEIGIVDYMKDPSGAKEGSAMYFGTQLRMDF